MQNTQSYFVHLIKDCSLVTCLAFFPPKRTCDARSVHSEGTAMLPVAEIVSILSASVEDLIVCYSVLCTVLRAANGCCRAKTQETSTNENMGGDERVLSLQCTEKQTEGSW